MNIEGLTTLEERGLVWQAIGFALIGAASLTVLTIYSEADILAVELYRLASTEYQWSFIGLIALTIDRVRKMFETRTEIRKAARERAIEKATSKGVEQGLEQGLELGVEKGRDEATARIRASLLRHGVELPPELEHELFENGR